MSVMRIKHRGVAYRFWEKERRGSDGENKDG